ncbi:MAG: type II toxin-antitoxin system VapC family toxin [Acidobacteria bacterium]|nr:type II toxin-antitoxin system VapC family toxin [Acidobacteriota bacterium]
MAVLVDTNVLIFSVQAHHIWHEASKKAIKAVLASGEPVFVLPQNVAEFWNACTRPADRNGLGLSSHEADSRLTDLERIVTVLHDTPAVYAQWRKLLAAYEVKGVQVHDARIAAAMQVHGIRSLLTYNPRGFRRFEGIIAVRPDEAAQPGMN